MCRVRYFPFAVLAVCSSIFAGGFAPATTCAATPVGGDIDVDTTWDINGAPYQVVSDVLVKNGATLTIQPGVEVWLDQTRSIYVDTGSTLAADGNQDSTIVFTRSGGFGHWGTIAAYEATMSFRHCLLEWGGTGFFHGQLSDGMISHDRSTTVVEDCTLRETSLDATEFARGRVVFCRNLILDTGRQAFNSYQRCISTIEDNRVERPAEDAFDIDRVREGELTFRNNIAIDVGDDGLDIDWWDVGPARIGYFEAYDVGDKGVSVSLNSEAVTVENTIIVNAREAYTVTNNSSLTVNNCVAYGCERGFSAYEKDPPNGGGTISVAGSITWETMFEQVFVDAESQATVVYSILDTDDPYPGDGNLNVNPNFLRPELNDFRLRYDSPAIDASFSDRMPETDIRGNPRVDHPGVPDTGAPPITYYDVGAHEFDPTVTAIIPGMGAPPVAGFGLRAFPSPSFGSVNIDFELAEGRQVEVGIYDPAGRLVRRVFTGPLGAGRHTLSWGGGGARARSGLYFIRLRAGGEEQVERWVRGR
jgi:hypothetical protein